MCYVGLFFGEMVVVLYCVIDILCNCYGDCKDYVVLFGVLFVVVGICSELVLINFGLVYMLLLVFGYGVGVINYVIMWLFDFGFYVDMMMVGIVFGYLLLIVMDCLVLLVDMGVLLCMLVM